VVLSGDTTERLRGASRGNSYTPTIRVTRGGGEGGCKVEIPLDEQLYTVESAVGSVVASDKRLTAAQG